MVVDSLEVPARHGGSFTLKAGYSTGRVHAISGPIALKGHRVDMLYFVGGDIPHALLQFRKNGEIVGNVTLDTHIARRVEVWLSQHTDYVVDS